MTRRCSSCGEEKDFSDFYRHPFGRDGIQPRCKDCCIKAERLRRITKPEKFAEYERARSRKPDRIKMNADRCRKWREANPEKYRTHNILYSAVRDGKIKKPEACELCGSKSFIHAHHTDYSRPLEVVWLCAKCHGQIQ